MKAATYLSELMSKQRAPLIKTQLSLEYKLHQDPLEITAVQELALQESSSPRPLLLTNLQREGVENHQWRLRQMSQATRQLLVGLAVADLLTWNTRKLLAILLDRAKRYCGGKLVITYEEQADTRRYGQEGRDSDALYSLMLSTEGVEAVVFLRQESDTKCTAGFRSLNDCDVSVIASGLGGGGHKNASGASVEGRLEQIIPRIVQEFEKVL